MAKESSTFKRRIRIKLKGYDHRILDSSTRQIVKIAQRYGVEVIGPVPLPTRIHKHSVHRSAFVHEDSHEQFETRIHKRLIDVIDPGADIVDALRDLNLPAGVDIKIEAS